jgi:hypothetical protein
MTKILIPHVINPHSCDAMIDPQDRNRAQLTFFVGDRDVHYVVMTRSELEKLDRDIQRELKAGSPPSARP